MANRRPLPEYYRNHISPPFAKIYYPTADEFSDPFTYVDSIRFDGRHFGVIKIVPPKGFKPPFALPRSLEFRPRAQRICLTDVFTKEHFLVFEKMRIFYEDEPSKRMVPKFDGKELNLSLFCLAIDKYHVDEQEVGKEVWEQVANYCVIPTKHAVSLKYYYGHIFGDFYACLKSEQALRRLASKGDYPLEDEDEAVEQSEEEESDDNSEEGASPPSELEDFPTSEEQEEQFPEITEEEPDCIIDDSFLPTEDPKSVVLPSPATDTEPDAEQDDSLSEAPCLEPISKKQRMSIDEDVIETEVSLDAPTDLDCHVIDEGSSPPAVIVELSPTPPPEVKPEITVRPPRRAKTDFLARLMSGFDGSDLIFSKKKPKVVVPPPVEAKEDPLPELPDIDREKDLLPTIELQKEYKVPFLAPKVDQSIPQEFAISAATARNFFDAPECFTLQSFKDHADRFKALYFKKKRSTDIKVGDVESEFWKHMGDMESDLYAFYGADLNSGNFGSGFPIFPKTRQKQETMESYFMQYAKHPWNLNNMPIAPKSAFSHLEANISGMTIPWVYVGMCFSLFCWHVEDHWTYSINYMHEGETKVWYGIPERDAIKFDRFMESLAPESFVENKDLLHHMNTMIHPQVLRDNGIEVYTVHQNIGEIVITFPRAYHAGFNSGYNVAEAVNFAPYDWLQAGRRCLSNYARVGRGCVFSHDSLVFNMAKQRHHLDQKMFNAVSAEYRAILRRERYYRKYLDRNIFRFNMCSVNLAEIVTNEDFRSCIKCNTLMYSSAILCKHMKSACPVHYKNLCKICPLSRYRFGYTDDLVSMRRAYGKFLVPVHFRLFEKLCQLITHLLHKRKIKKNRYTINLILISLLKRWTSHKSNVLLDMLKAEIFKCFADPDRPTDKKKMLVPKKSLQKALLVHFNIDLALNGDIPMKSILQKCLRHNLMLSQKVQIGVIRASDLLKKVKLYVKLRTEIQREIARNPPKRATYDDYFGTFRIPFEYMRKKSKKVKKCEKKKPIFKKTVLVTIPETPCKNLVPKAVDGHRAHYTMAAHKIPAIVKKRWLVGKPPRWRKAPVTRPVTIYNLLKTVKDSMDYCIPEQRRLFHTMRACARKRRFAFRSCSRLSWLFICMKCREYLRQRARSAKDDIKNPKIEVEITFFAQLAEMMRTRNRLARALYQLKNDITGSTKVSFLLRMDLLKAAECIADYEAVNRLRYKCQQINVRVPDSRYTSYTFNEIVKLYNFAKIHQANPEIMLKLYYIEDLLKRSAEFEEHAEDMFGNATGVGKGIDALREFSDKYVYTNTWFGEDLYMHFFDVADAEENVAQSTSCLMRKELHTLDAMKTLNVKLNHSTIMKNTQEHMFLTNAIPKVQFLQEKLSELFNSKNSYGRVIDILYGRHDLKLVHDKGRHAVEKFFDLGKSFKIDNYMKTKAYATERVESGHETFKTCMKFLINFNHSEIADIKDGRALCNCNSYCEADLSRPLNWIPCLICGVRNHIQCAIWNDHFSEIRPGTYYCQRCLSSKKPLLSELTALEDPTMKDMNDYFVFKLFLKQQQDIFDHFHSLDMDSLSKSEFLQEAGLVLAANTSDGETEQLLLNHAHYADYYTKTQLERWKMVQKVHRLFEDIKNQRSIIYEYRQPKKKAFSDRTIIKEPLMFEVWGVKCKNEKGCKGPVGRTLAYRCINGRCPHFRHFVCETVNSKLLDRMVDYRCKTCSKSRKR